MHESVDPLNITDFNRTQYELEAFWLFAILVAGKNTSVQAKKLSGFLQNGYGQGLTPFAYITQINRDGLILNYMKAEKLGQYTRIHRAFVESLNVDLHTCSVDELENIHGVGCKTSRFFILHSRENQNFAVLDTHILKFLKSKGYDVPLKTPTNTNTYKRIEQYFLDCVVGTGMTVAEFDLYVWTYYNRKDVT